MTKAAGVSVELTAIEIEHLLLVLSCFDSEVDEHFHVTAKLQSAMEGLNKMFPVDSGGKVG